MANTTETKCPKCESTKLEISPEDHPLQSEFKIYYIRCSFCKTFLQEIPFQDTNTLISNMQSDIDKLKTKAGVYN